jgi:hypothetical protein
MFTNDRLHVTRSSGIQKVTKYGSHTKELRKIYLTKVKRGRT